MAKRKTEEIREEPTFEMGSRNVFADLGLRDADEIFAKAQVCAIVAKLIEAQGLTQKEVARILGIHQPTVSDIVNGRSEGFSIERLFRFINQLGQDIEIVIRKPKEDASVYVKFDKSVKFDQVPAKKPRTKRASASDEATRDVA